MIDEKSLVERAKADSAEFIPLYDRYAERIYAYLRRETVDAPTAQDLTAATFEKALRQLPRYEWRGVPFGAWLYKIARNELRLHWRKSKHTLPLLDRFVSPLNVERLAQERDQMSQIERAMLTLRPRDHEILRLHYFEELSHEELAEVLDCSRNSVRVRLHRALDRLKRAVSSEQLAVNSKL